MVLYYLFLKEDKEGVIVFSIKNLISFWGFTPQRNNNKINMIFKNILDELKNNNIIISNIDFNSISISDFVTVKFYSENNIPWYLNSKNYFVSLSIQELKTLKNYIDNSNEKIQIEKILYLYLLIKSYMNFSSQSLKYCFSSLDNLIKKSGLSRSSVLKYMSILQQANMIYIYDVGEYVDIDINIQKSPIIYTLEKININLLKNNISSYLTNFNYWI